MNLEYVKGILFVRLKGDLNEETSAKINDYLIPVIKKQGIKNLVYNFYDLVEVDKSGVKALENSIKAINKNKGEIYICEIPNKYKETFQSFKASIASNELSAIEMFTI